MVSELSQSSIRRSPWLRPVALFLGVAASVWISLRWFGGPRAFLDLWPCNAIALAIALPVWREKQNRLRLTLACAVGFLAAALLLPMPPWAAVWLAVVCAIQLWCTCYILSFSIASFEDLKSVWNVVRFIVVTLIVTAGSAELSVHAIAGVQGTPLLETWLRVAQADMLGLMSLFPFALLITSGRARSFGRIRRHTRVALFWTFSFSLTAVVVFSQSQLPLLFLVFPPLIGFVMALGTEGAAIVILLVTLIGGWLTELGHGPIMLIPNPTRDIYVFVFQIFIMAVVAVALPVGALLDERRRAQLAETEAQNIYTTLLKHADDIVIQASLTDPRNFVSPSALKVSGWTEREFLHYGPHGPIHPKDQDLIESLQIRVESGEERATARYRMLCKDGSYRWVEATATGYRRHEKGRVEGYVATVRDISSQMEMELAWSTERAAMARENSKLVDLAWKDELTGLANRRSFNQLLGIELSRKARTEVPLSLLIIDVDHFKNFNDVLGHPAGDRCLQTVAHALRSAASRATDTPARVGGEEFAIILPATDTDGAVRVGAKIRDVIAKLEIAHPGSPLERLSVSVGAATIPSGYEATMESLIQAADQALYESKQNGRDQLTVGASVGKPRVAVEEMESRSIA